MGTDPQVLWSEARIVVRAGALSDTDWKALRNEVAEALGPAPTPGQRRIYDAVKKRGGPPHPFWNKKFWKKLTPRGGDRRATARRYLRAVDAIEGPEARVRLEDRRKR